jgi:hypothetical protein
MCCWSQKRAARSAKRPFSIDKKPNHGSPDYARDIAFQKIANRVAGTKMAA